VVVALVLAVSPLAFEAVSLFMLPFCFRTCVMPRDAKEYSEVGELNVVLMRGIGVIVSDLDLAGYAGR
jgi:hypothetical protein